GRFTGKKLGDYLNATATDYRAARAIVNADVKANGSKIAGHAAQFEAALKAGGYTSQKAQPPVSAPEPSPAPIPPKEPEPLSFALPAPSKGFWAWLLSLFTKKEA